MSSRKDDYECDDGGLSDDQWSDDTVYDNDVYWDPVLKRRFKTRHEHSANASNRGSPEPSKVVPKEEGSEDSWGEPNTSKNSREASKDSSLLPRNDDNKRMSAPGNDEIAEERGRSVSDRDGSDKPENFIHPGSQCNNRSRTNNHGYEDQNSSKPRGDGSESRPALSRETHHHSTAPPVFDNTMPSTSHFDQAADAGVRRNEEPLARNPVEYRYDQRRYDPPPNPNYGSYEPHTSIAPPHNQAPYYPQRDVLSREMSGMTISRGDQRSRVPMEPSSLVESEYEGWNRADLNKELKRIEERTRAIMKVMKRNERNPKYLDCSDVALVTPPSRAMNQDNSISRDNVPPSYVPTQPPHNYPQNSGTHQPQPQYQESRQPSGVYPPQQSQQVVYATPSQQHQQQQQYTVKPSYAPTQTHNYSQPQNSGNQLPQSQYQDSRQSAGVAYPPQQNQGHEVYATNSQQPQHLQHTVQPSYAPTQTYNYAQPQNFGTHQQQPQYQDSHQPGGFAYPPQQIQGPPAYASTSQQPQPQQYSHQPTAAVYPPQQNQGPDVYATTSQQAQQYTVPPSNIAPQPQNYPQNVGGYPQNQDSRHQVSPPQQNYGYADYQKPVYQMQPHQYSDQPSREAYPSQQNSGYGVHSYQQTQQHQSTASTMSTAPQYPPSNVIPQPHNYSYDPQNLTNNQQQYYQDSRQPSRQVSPTQQYPVYPVSTNYQQPPHHHVAIPPSQVAPQTYNYSYAPQNYTNQQQHHHYQDSRQPSRQVSPTQQYPAYSANYQQSQQQPNAAVPYSHIPPQQHYSREDAEIASFTQQRPATTPLPQEIPQNTSISQLPQQQQASPESSAAVPSDPIRAEAAPSSGTDYAQPRYNKKGKLIIEPSEEVRQWHMKRRQEEKEEKAARFRESPAYAQYTKVKEDYERRKAAGEYN